MVEPTRYVRSSSRVAGRFDRDVNDVRLTSSHDAQPRAAKSGYPLGENLPIFLSAAEEENRAELQDNWVYDDREHEAWPAESALQHHALQQNASQQSDWQHSGYEQDPWEQESWEAQRRKGSIVARVVKFGLVAAAVAGAVFAAFTYQGPHALIADASASLSAALPGLSKSKTQAPASQPASQAMAAPAQLPPSQASAPSRQAIANAFQTALQTQPAVQQPQPVIPQPAIVPATPAPAPAARTMDPGELATLLKRAQTLMDIGDIASARLFLERAAGAQNAKAALLLAQTYDPAVLGTTDQRTITADPATARLWYQKAAEFGSEEARNRLAQMTN
jgi:hypothetical protein